MGFNNRYHQLFSSYEAVATVEFKGIFHVANAFLAKCSSLNRHRASVVWIPDLDSPCTIFASSFCRNPYKSIEVHLYASHLNKIERRRVGDRK
jgi:hypothetical protein